MFPPINRWAIMECPSGTKTDAIVPEGRSILAHRFNGGITGCNKIDSSRRDVPYFPRDLSLGTIRPRGMKNMGGIRVPTDKSVGYHGTSLRDEKYGESMLPPINRWATMERPSGTKNMGNPCSHR